MPTLTDPDQDKLNPAAQQERDLFEQDFGNRPTLDEGIASREGAADQARSRLGNDLKAAEDGAVKQAGGPAQNGAANLDQAENNPSWTTSAPSTPAPSKGGGGLLKNPIARRWAIGGAISLTLGVFTAMSQIPQFMILQLKELVSSKIDRDSNNTNSRRFKKVVKNNWFKVDPNCTGRKCAKGISDAEVEKLRKAGLNPEVTKVGTTNQLDFLTTSDPETGEPRKVDANTFEREMSTNAKFLSSMNSAFDPRDFVNRGPLTIARIKFFGMTRKLFSTSTDPKKLEQDFRRTTYGADGDDNVGRVGSCTQSNSDGTCVDPNEERQRAQMDRQLGDAVGEIRNGAAQVRAELEGNNYERPPSVTPDMSYMDTDPQQAFGILGRTVRSAVGAAFKGVFAFAEKACAMMQIIRTVTMGAKILAVFGLLVYLSTFLAAADSLKAGDGNYAVISFLANLLITPSVAEGSKGFNFFDGPFLGYMSEGKINSRKSLGRYVYGQPPLRMISKVNDIISSSGVSVSTCRHINSWYGQLVGLTTGILTLVFTGGTVNAAAVAGSVSAQVILSVLSAYAIPMLIRLFAGTVAPDPKDPERGYGISAALTVGAMLWRNFRGKNMGDRPLAKTEVAQFNKEANAQLALDTKARNYGKNPLDINQPNSVTSRLAMQFAPALLTPTSQANYQTMAALASSPFSLLSGSLGKVLSPAVGAQTYDGYAGQFCQDPDSLAMPVAVDATCVPVGGEFAEKLESKKYDPQVVVNYMIDRGHIDDQNEPTSDDYKKFIADCFEGVTPYTPDGRGIDITEDIDTRECLVHDTRDDLNSDNPNYDGKEVMYDMFRMFRRDNNLVESVSDSANGTLGLSDDELPGDSPITGPLNPGAFTWPIAPSSVSTISSCMNQTDPSYRIHSGLDIAAPMGTSIVAVADGQVVFESKNVSGFGYYVAIKHTNGSITGYGHNIENLVLIGDTVKQGQPIAKVGTRGQSTGPHLHMNYIPDGSSPFTTKINSFNPLFNNLMPKPEDARDAAGCMTPGKLKSR